MLPELEHLLESGKIAGFSKEKRAKYDADMITERDMYNIIETARQEGETKGREAGFAEGEAKGREDGLAEGEAKGREAGLAEGKAEVARNMLASGMPEEQVMAMTGLTAGQLAALK